MKKLGLFLLKNNIHLMTLIFIAWAVWAGCNWAELVLVQKLVLGLYAWLIIHEYEEGYKNRFLDLMLGHEAIVRQTALSDADNGQVVIGFGHAYVIRGTSVDTGYVVTGLIGIQAVFQRAGIREQVVHPRRQFVSEEHTGLDAHHEHTDQHILYHKRLGFPISLTQIVPNTGTCHGLNGRVIHRRPHDVSQNGGDQLQTRNDEQVEAQRAQISRSDVQLAAGRQHPKGTERIGGGG